MNIFLIQFFIICGIIAFCVALALSNPMQWTTVIIGILAAILSFNAYLKFK